MIGYLAGKAQFTDNNHIILNVNGVGYELSVPETLLQRGIVTNQDLELYVYTHVTEANLQLFGFESLQQKKLFLKIISINGVGPKLGLAILSDLSVKGFLQAVFNGDVTRLTKVSGVGKKTAERLVMELKDKLKAEVMFEPEVAANDDFQSDNRLTEVQQALQSLGYHENIAKRVVKDLRVTENDTTQSLIKKSLMQMQKQG
ncbi:MAG: Holliday junction branch migration protein RuvA [Deltaproteobacteria bacterium]|nr:Holliday junction branch migration protein RuvA [Deltaproteobacteria bacterium]